MTAFSKEDSYFLTALIGLYLLLLLVAAVPLGNYQFLVAYNYGNTLLTMWAVLILCFCWFWAKASTQKRYQALACIFSIPAFFGLLVALYQLYTPSFGPLIFEKSWPAPTGAMRAVWYYQPLRDIKLSTLFQRGSTDESSLLLVIEAPGALPRTLYRSFPWEDLEVRWNNNQQIDITQGGYHAIRRIDQPMLDFRSQAK